MSREIEPALTGPKPNPLPPPKNNFIQFLKAYPTREMNLALSQHPYIPSGILIMYYVVTSYPFFTLRTEKH
jgi:hypothetical protein